MTPLVEGFWDSNIDTRANPLFTLARGSRFLSKLPKSERPPERVERASARWRGGGRVDGGRHRAGASTA